jgi:4'-phosphopantetheinyl transferase
MSAGAHWLSPQTHPELTRDDVHVWSAGLDLDLAVFRQLESTLSRDEQTRAQRFLFERDQHSYTAARGILRHLLGRYLQCPPHTLEFSYGSNGKPELSGRHASAPVRFNLSHSHGAALFALALDRRIGVDLEWVRTQAAREDIAARYFSAREMDELRNLPVEQRAEGFFLCWTRKEAYIKANGAGLQIPLNSFDVSLSPGRPATLSVNDDRGWGIESFDVPVIAEEPGHYVGALVVEGENYHTTFFDWDGEHFV